MLSSYPVATMSNLDCHGRPAQRANSPPPASADERLAKFRSQTAAVEQAGLIASELMTVTFDGRRYTGKIVWPQV